MDGEKGAAGERRAFSMQRWGWTEWRGRVFMGETIKLA